MQPCRPSRELEPLLELTEELRATSELLVHETRVLLETNNALCEKHVILLREARRLRALRAG